MNKNTFWNKISESFSLAKNGEIWLYYGCLAYENERDQEIIINYKEFGYDADSLWEELNQFEKNNLIEIIDTNNLSYIIIKK